METEEFKITGKEVKAALKTSFPIMVTFLVLGSGYGILMEKHGFGPLWSVLSGIVIFSGTVQFVSISMLGTGSFLGGVMGTYLNFDSTGIDFSMTALFTTVFIQQWLDAKNHISAILGLGATLLCRIIFGTDLFLIPAMIIIIGTLTLARRKIEPEEVHNG